jgi:hypothetical protein
MRRIAILCLLALVALPAAAQRAGDAPALAAFAQRVGLRDVDGFVATVGSLRSAQRLPARYATKDEAAGHGWRGGGLCGVWPGHAIGGDQFHNFAKTLPAAPGRNYREADLDSDCKSRGAKRLIFSNDGLLFVTVDHYSSFVPVP